MSWGKWPDLFVDFGMQIYVAWRLSEGDVLYRDIIYFMGPLSSYLHGFIFKLFGPGFLVLATFNFLLVIGLAALIYNLFTYLGDRLSGTLSALTFIIIFAFSQYLWMGNHNFVVSYVYDLTHGIFLSFVSLLLIKRFALRGTSLNSAILGIFTGLIFLTKFEVFLAWAVSLTLAFLLIYKFSQSRGKKFAKLLLIFLIAAALPPCAFLIYFSIHMPFTKALEAILNSYGYILGSPSISLTFYKKVMGLSAVSANLKSMAFFGSVWAIVVAAIVLAGCLSKKYFNNSVFLNLALLCLVPGALFFYQEKIQWLEALRPLPVVMILFGAYLFVARADYFKDPSKIARGVVLFSATAFSAVLLVKIFLNAHVYHYGAALAMPATLILIHIIFYEAPRIISRTFDCERFYTWSALILFILIAYSHARISSDFYMKKAFPVGRGDDLMIGYSPDVTPRDMIFQIALDVLEEEVPVGKSIATFPTGALLNYMVKRASSIRSVSFNPVIFKQIGEPAVLRSLKANPPDYIVILFHDYLEFEYRYFGLDFGIGIYEWTQNNYALFKQIGSDPVKDKSMGIQIFKLNSAAVKDSQNRS